jgi:hypothetical protein
MGRVAATARTLRDINHFIRLMRDIGRYQSQDRRPGAEKINRYNEVSETLADRPQGYRLIFMAGRRRQHHRARLGGRLRARDWVALQGMGTMHPAHQAPPGAGPDPGLLGGRARSLVGHAGRGEAPAASHTAHEEIARAVAAARTICNPSRAAKASRHPVKRRHGSRTRRQPRRAARTVKPPQPGDLQLPSGFGGFVIR